MTTETKGVVLVKHRVKQLKLPTMHDVCEPVAGCFARGNLDHLGYLLQISELELMERERRAIERRLNPPDSERTRRLMKFDFAARPSINKPLLMDLICGEYLNKRENILFIGGSGIGKTDIAITLGIAD